MLMKGVILSLLISVLLLSVSTERTAVCITGLSRTLFTHINETKHELMNKDFHHLKTTVADSILEFLSYNNIGKRGMDLFLVIPSESAHNMTQEDKVKVCSGLHDYHLFNPTHKHKNNFFCHVTQEEEMYDWAMSRNPNLTMFSDGKAETYNMVTGWLNKTIAVRLAREKFLRQIWALQYCNNVTNQYASAHGVTYKYKMRIRSDMAFKPGARITSWLDLGRSTQFDSPLVNNAAIEIGSKCNRLIAISEYKYFRGGNQDTFAFGTAADMDYRYSVFDALMTTNILTNLRAHLASHDMPEHFTSESILEYYLYRSGICLREDHGIKAVILRTGGRSFSTYGNLLENKKKKYLFSDASYHLSSDELSKWLNMNELRTPTIPFNDMDLLSFGLQGSKAVSQIFVFQNTSLRPVKNMDFFRLYNFDLGNVKVVPAYWQEEIPEGPIYQPPRKPKAQRLKERLERERLATGKKLQNGTLNSTEAHHAALWSSHEAKNVAQIVNY